MPCSDKMTHIEKARERLERINAAQRRASREIRLMREYSVPLYVLPLGFLVGLEVVGFLYVLTGRMSTAPHVVLGVTLGWVAGLLFALVWSNRALTRRASEVHQEKPHGTR